MIVERVNRFFGYAAINRIVFRQGRLPVAAPKPERPQLRPVPKELGEGLREIADPELRHCLECLHRKLPLAAARRRCRKTATTRSPSSTGAFEPMKVRNILTASMAVLALGACNKDNQTSGGGDAPASTVQITQANPPAGGTWADVTNATSAGGFMMGNPNAKVKLVEIGSLFCPVCKRFADEGMPTLVNNYVKSGQVSWEFRPYIIHGPIDMAANLSRAATAPKTFFPLARGAVPRSGGAGWARSKQSRRTRWRKSRTCRSSR